MNFKKILASFVFIAGFCQMYAFTFNGTIVTPEHATPAEVTAANELSDYLTKMGVSNTQVTEANAGNVSAGAIWLGPTKQAAALRKIVDFTPDKAELGGNPLLHYVHDTEAPSGFAVQLTPGTNPNSNYSFPLNYGAYSPGQGKIISYGVLNEANMLGTGYHYYKLMDFTPGISDCADCYFYFFDWTLSYPTANTLTPNVHYTVWASIKFTGPAYPPYGKVSDPNGIYVERIFLVSDASSSLNFNSDQAILNNNPLLSVVTATDTESGSAVRLLPGTTPNSNYTMPLTFGVYSASLGKDYGSSTLPAASVVGAEYHYYKLMTFSPDSDFYSYFFRDWNLSYQMCDVVAENGPGKYSAWARLKFTGPSYPYGLSTDPNGIYVDRVILVKDKPLVTLSGGTPSFNGNTMYSLPNPQFDHPVLVSPGPTPTGWFNFPLCYGAYCSSTGQIMGSGQFSSVDSIIPGGGYNDYTLMTFTPGFNDFYLYFFDWTLHYPMSNVLLSNGPNVSYEVHASIKFTGPAYGGAGANGIYIDNVRFVPVQ